MFYYKEKIPSVDDIVLAVLISEYELSDDISKQSCAHFYLPEYNNIIGIVYKKEFPSRERAHKNFIKYLEKTKIFVCVVVNVTETIIELTMKKLENIQNNQSQNKSKIYKFVSTRLKQIVSIKKLVKYLSIETLVDFNILIDNLDKNFIKPLKMTNIDNLELDLDLDSISDSISDLNSDLNSELNSIKNIEKVNNEITDDPKNILKYIKMNELNDDIVSKINEVLEKHINRLISNGSTINITVPFEFALWSSKRFNMNLPDEQFVNLLELMKNMFKTIVATIPTCFSHIGDVTCNIKCIGSPKYSLVIAIVITDLENKNSNNINHDEIINKFKLLVDNFILTNNINGYLFVCNNNDKLINCSIKTINYPYEIEL
jgi:translation initiation factor 2 alpha subunit (eIF-2alpha)